jgi:GTP-binding protein
MSIKQIGYVGSFNSIESIPIGLGPHFAFIGRSNVGKSSLINVLCERKNLARTSREPGKTRSINLYHVNSNWVLVDLPGYGYAKTSKVERQKFQKLIEDYLTKCPDLMTAFVLIDSSIPTQSNDVDFLNFIGQNNIPFNLVFMKIDKIKPRNRRKSISGIKGELLQFWEILPDQFIISSVTREGKEDLLDYIGQLIQIYYQDR